MNGERKMRRMPDVKKCMNLAEAGSVIREYVLAGLTSPHIIISPVCRNPNAPRPYFTVSGCDESGWRADALDQELYPVLIDALAAHMAELPEGSKAMVIHMMSDELGAALLCKELWPGPRIERVCEEMKREMIYGSGLIH